MIIGLTGGSGCGTSMAGRLLGADGWLFIDCDAVYHRLLAYDSALSARLVETFGEDILSSTGLIDRRALGEIVFSDPEKLKQLNAITHPAILERVTQLIAASDRKDICIEAVELLDSGICTLCSGVIGVLADYDTRIYRIMIRDAILRSAAVRRIEAQHPDSYYLSRCDCCVYNNGTVEEFQAALKAAVDSLRERENVRR